MNMIQLRGNNDGKTIFIVTPVISPNPNGPKYAEYCLYMLIKYKPWDISSSYYFKLAIEKKV